MVGRATDLCRLEGKSDSLGMQVPRGDQGRTFDGLLWVWYGIYGILGFNVPLDTV